MIKFRVLSFMVLGSCGLFIAATTAFADTALARLNAFFSNVTSMQANFEQIIVSDSMPSVDQSKGVLYMQRPGKFRWDYKAPYEQHIVADGNKLWIYDVDLEQVVVKPLDLVLGNTPAVLLSGDASITEKFVVTTVSEMQSGLDVKTGKLALLELRPKDKEANFEKITLAFAGDNLQMMELKDAFGQLTRLTFSNLQRNPILDSKLFEFTPPAGVDVINETP